MKAFVIYVKTRQLHKFVNTTASMQRTVAKWQCVFEIPQAVNSTKADAQTMYCIMRIGF